MGQLGIGIFSGLQTPWMVASPVKAIAAGGSHSLFLKTDGTIWATGYNGQGEYGDGSAVNHSTPVLIDY